MAENMMELINITKTFGNGSRLLGKRSHPVHAVSRINLQIQKGEVFGLVGESGCGKSTLGRMILRLTEPTSGGILFQGKDMTTCSKREMRTMRKDMQIIFQDPYASLDPRMKVKDILAEPLKRHGLIPTKKKQVEQIAELAEKVGLNPEYIYRYPHELSGGQRQRVGIARALALDPQFILSDEATSALDVSVQAQILNLLKTLQKELQLTMMFISHDLSVVRHISNRIGVMYFGSIVEIADKRHIYSEPMHPYTQALISSVPIPDPFLKKEKITLQGELPDPSNPPMGCPLYDRCPMKMDVCQSVKPELNMIRPNHYVACHLYE